MTFKRRQIVSSVALLGAVGAIGAATYQLLRPTRGSGAAVEPPKTSIASNAVLDAPSRAAVPQESDIVVIGSGAAGLMAALTAADRGASVTVLEATALIGGTTAFSGGLLWVPFNKLARAAGCSDERSAAEAYVRRCLGKRADDLRWAVFFDHVNDVVDFLESRAGIRFLLTRYPDSFAEWPEGRDCRQINIAPFDLSLVGKWRDRIRRPPGSLVLLTIPDIEASTRPMAVADASAMAKFAAIVARRTLKGEVTMGYALVAALLRACVLRNVQVHTGLRVTELLLDRSGVRGVAASTGSGNVRVLARKAVVLACGGFDWNEALKRQYLPGRLDATQTPPVNRGDNLLLGSSVGAALQATDEAWYLPGVIPPGAQPYEGELLGTSILSDRMLPHSIWVNREGKRFVNEGAQNAANSFYTRNAAGDVTNIPCFHIFDAQYRRKYPVLASLSPRDKDPSWLVRADSPPQLARLLGIDAAGLAATLARFNDSARLGRDPDFGRGAGAFERYFGDPDAPFPNLGTVEQPPFYAFEVHQSSVGTKGGPLTDAQGRVMRQSGEPIRGLYAAGNASAAFNGPLTVAPGSTLPPAMVMAYVGVLHALGMEANVP